MRSALLTEYLDKMTNIVKMSIPNISEEDIRETIRKDMKDKLKNETLDFEGNRVGILQMVEYIRDNKLIITGYGALYKNQDTSGDNLLASLCEYFNTERSYYKGEKFKHINDEDPTEMENFDTMQKNVKVLNNSIFGTTIERNSIFYEPYLGPSITYTGENIITTSVNVFEEFLANNFTFKTVGDSLIYINHIINEKYHHNDIITNNITSDALKEYITSKIIKTDNMELVEDLIDNLSQEDINKVYYKNNFFKFIDNPKILSIFESIIGIDQFTDPNKPPKEIIPIMDGLWEYISEWVFYNYSNFYRTDKCMNDKRQSILTIDTDSNFGVPRCA